MEDKITFTIKIKKKVILLIASVVLIVAFFILGGVLFLKSKENGTVIVRGKVITDIPIELDPPEQNMLVPLVAVLQELDYGITQQEKSVIIITNDNQKFELNLEALSLYEVGEIGLNYLESPPGFYYSWCHRNGTDIELDIVTFNSALALMDSNYRITDIPELKTVIVYKLWLKR